MHSKNYFTLKFLFTYKKTTESDQKIESLQSVSAVQPKYLECEASELLGNYLRFGNWKDC